MIEQGDPLSWCNQVPHSCQAWWRQTYLWLTILHKKIYCEDIENELKSYHNKTEWANVVLMQQSWPQLKSDSISWRETLKNPHNSQILWPVVSTLCQEMKVYLNQKVGKCQGETTNSEKNFKGNGRVSSDRTKRWRWSPERLLVDSRWLHLSSSQWTSSSTLRAEGRNIPCSTEIHWCYKVYSYWSGCVTREKGLTIIGTSTRTEVCQILGKDSQN